MDKAEEAQEARDTVDSSTAMLGVLREIAEDLSVEPPYRIQAAEALLAADRQAPRGTPGLSQ